MRTSVTSFIVLVLVAIGAQPVRADTVSSEAAEAAYADGWYRTVRMGTWLWEGAERSKLEETLERIAAAQGPRRWDDRADTLIEHGPGHWVYEFSATARAAYEAGLMHEAHGEPDAARKRFMQAAIYYTIASYPHLRDAPSRTALSRAFDAYARAGRHFAVPLEVWQMEVEGIRFPAFVHLPTDVKGPVPVVLKTGGMDVLSTEFYSLYEPLTERGMAMITFDMPGTGNDALVGEDADKHHVAVLERARDDPRFDADRIAVWSASLGGMPAVKVAITQQAHLRAVVNGCGLVHAVHAFELGGPPQEGEGLAGVIAAYNAGQLSDAQVAEIEAAFASPELEAQQQSFQFEVYVDRYRAKPGSLLDLAAKARPVSLKVQGLLGRGVVTDVPILSVNTHVDPLVPQTDSLMATDASKHGTLMLFGEHDGHCVARTVGNPAILEWLSAQMR